MPPVKTLRSSHLLPEMLYVKSVADAFRPLAVDAAWGVWPTSIGAKRVSSNAEVLTSLREGRAANTLLKCRQCARKGLAVLLGKIFDKDVHDGSLAIGKGESHQRRIALPLI